MKHPERLKKTAGWSRQLGCIERDSFIDYKLSFNMSSYDGYTAIITELAGKNIVVRNAYSLLMKMKNSSEE